MPTPRVNLARYHGVFAPNHRLREQVTPAKRGRRGAQTANEPARHVSMTPDQVRGRLWAQRLKRVVKIDILTCTHCGGAVKVIASIEDPAVIKQILEHLERHAEPATPAFRPFARAPPPMALPQMVPELCLFAYWRKRITAMLSQRLRGLELRAHPALSRRSAVLAGLAEAHAIWLHRIGLTAEMQAGEDISATDTDGEQTYQYSLTLMPSGRGEFF